MTRLLHLPAPLLLVLCLTGCGSMMRRPSTTLAGAVVTHSPAGATVVEYRVWLKNPNGFPVAFDPPEYTTLRLLDLPVAHTVEQKTVRAEEGGRWVKAGVSRHVAFRVSVPRQEVLRLAHRRAGRVPLSLRGVVFFWDWGYTPLTGGSPWPVGVPVRWSAWLPDAAVLVHPDGEGIALAPSSPPCP